MKRQLDRILRWINHPVQTTKNAWTKLRRTISAVIFRIYYGNNIVLLESHHEFGGNSGALFRYMQKDPKYSGYTYVWFVKDYVDGTFKNTRRVLVFSFKNTSLKQQYLINHAKVAFFDDVPVRAKGKGAKTIYLTHGAGPVLKNVKGIIVIPSYVFKALCTSENIVDIESEQFSFPKEKFFICGQPRNDVLYEERVDISSAIRLDKSQINIIWLPTFRKARGTERNDSCSTYPLGLPLIKNEDEFFYLQDELEKRNAHLLIKLHPLQDDSVITIQSTKNITILSNDVLVINRLDTNMLYPYFDAMISDYSSAPFDYMLLNRPLGYVIDDMDYYRLAIPEDDFNSRTPGNKIYTLNDFVSFIDAISKGIDEYKDERVRFTNYIHHFQDGNNCKRIIEMFLDN